MHQEDFSLSCRGVAVSGSIFGSGPAMPATPGAASADGAHPVVLLHGNPGSRRDWRPVLPLLTEQTTVVAFDRPGSGRSGAHAPWHRSISGNAALITDALGQLDLREVVVAGHSHGGGVALRMALDSPERVAGLALIGSIGVREALDWTDTVAALPLVGELAAFLALKVCGKLDARMIAGFSIGPAFEPSKRFADALGEACSSPGTWRRYVAEERAMIAETPVLERRLGEIRCPTVVINGDADPMVTPAAARRLASAIEGARIEIIERAGHILPHEAPGRLAHAITSLAQGDGRVAVSA